MVGVNIEEERAGMEFFEALYKSSVGEYEHVLHCGDACCLLEVDVYKFMYMVERCGGSNSIRLEVNAKDWEG